MSPCGVCWRDAALTTRHLAVTRLTVCTYCVYLKVCRRRLAEEHFSMCIYFSRKASRVASIPRVASVASSVTSSLGSSPPRGLLCREPPPSSTFCCLAYVANRHTPHPSPAFHIVPLFQHLSSHVLQQIYSYSGTLSLILLFALLFRFISFSLSLTTLPVSSYLLPLRQRQETLPTFKNSLSSSDLWHPYSIVPSPAALS